VKALTDYWTLITDYYEFAMTKLQKILTSLFVVQLVLVVVVFWPRGTAVAEAGPLFPDFNADDIVRVNISDSDGETAFVREGDGWALPDAGYFPANGEKISEILGKIAAMQTSRLIARTRESQARLQVDAEDYVRRVDMETADGTQYRLYIGSSPNAQGTHVRRGDRQETYLTGEIQNWEVASPINNWIDGAYVTLDREAVTAVTVENGNGVLNFEKVSETDWTMTGLGADQVFAATEFNTLLGQIVNLRMNRPLGKTQQAEYGLDNPQAIVTVTTDEGTFTLQIGALDADNSTYTAKWSGSDYYVTVNSFSVESFVTYTQDSFIEQPTPAAEGLEGGGG
jgi:hypothetical protein